MNNRYVIRVEHPLVRPGLTIETEASEKYVVQVVEKLMQAVREINLGSPHPKVLTYAEAVARVTEPTAK